LEKTLKFRGGRSFFTKGKQARSRSEARAVGAGKGKGKKEAGRKRGRRLPFFLCSSNARSVPFLEGGGKRNKRGGHRVGSAKDVGNGGKASQCLILAEYLGTKKRTGFWVRKVPQKG